MRPERPNPESLESCGRREDIEGYVDVNVRPVTFRIRTLVVALLLVALGTGVPVQGHAHHDGDGVHLGAPDHAHGVTLVQHDMRVERATPPAPPGLAAAVPMLEEPRCTPPPRAAREVLRPKSRAPPTGILPRPPPA